MLAGGLAYYFIYLPEQRRAQEIQVRSVSSRQQGPHSVMLQLLLLLLVLQPERVCQKLLVADCAAALYVTKPCIPS
jgi:hypothetical protein